MKDGERERSRLEIEETTGPIVKRIYRDASRGLGTKAIASALNTEGVPSPGKAHWGRSRVHSILINEAYIGNLVWGSGEYNRRTGQEPVRCEDAHEPLVSKEVFNRVQKLLVDRSPKDVFSALSLKPVSARRDHQMR